jgi:nitrogen fixation NifU-like protein
MGNVDYTDLVLDHFRNPRNMGKMENPDAEGTVGNPSCGDVMKMMFKIDGDVISDVKFLTMGCAAAIATSSVATELIKGKTISEAKKLTNKQVAEELGGLPPIKVHCSNLAEEAIEATIKNWEEKN